MNAIELIVQDQEMLRQKITSISHSASSIERRGIFEEKIRPMLEAYVSRREFLFFPSFEGLEEVREGLEKAHSGHLEIKRLMERVMLTQDSEELLDRLEDLAAAIKDQSLFEQAELFPKIQRAIPEMRLRRLGDLLLEARRGE